MLVGKVAERLDDHKKDAFQSHESLVFEIILLLVFHV
jgi:hypothetical protein